MTQLKRLLHTFPFFLLTIPLVFVLNAANHYYGLLNWNLVWPTMILYCALALPLSCFVYLLFKSWPKAFWYTGMLLVVFYFFAALHQFLHDSLPGAFSKYSVLLPALVLAASGLFIYLKKRSTERWRGPYVLNLLFMLLLTAGILQLLYKKFTHAELLNEQADPNKTLAKNYKRCDTCSDPDIYYLLFDGYTNSKTLQAEFNYNNQSFTDSLRQLGFHVIADSKSNYNFTHMSLSSVFNLDYLQRLDNSKTFYTKTFLQSYYTMYNNEWCQVLKKEGYEIKNYSIFDIKGANTKVEPYLTELSYRSVPGQTFFNKINRDIGWKWGSLFAGKDNDQLEYLNTNLKRIDQTFRGIWHEAQSKEPSPRFVYAHFMLPHETFYFDSTGKRQPVEYTISANNNKSGYLQQLIYTNKFIILPLVRHIVANSARPPIIIIQGDHGYRNYPSEKIALEFENLNAVFYPNRDYSAFDNTNTSVNTFRIVLNNYFGKNLPLLKDSTINLMKSNTK